MAILNKCLILVASLGCAIATLAAVGGRQEFKLQYSEAEFANLLAQDTLRLLGEARLEPHETVILLSRTINKDERLLGDYTVRDALNLNRVTAEFCNSVLLKIRLEFCRLLMAVPEMEPEQEAQVRGNVIYWCRKSLEDFVAHYCNESTASNADLGEPEFGRDLSRAWREFSLKHRSTREYSEDLLEGKMTEFEQFIRDYASRRR